MPAEKRRLIVFLTGHADNKKRASVANNNERLAVSFSVPVYDECLYMLWGKAKKLKKEREKRLISIT
jgi:hypothetical protein